MSTSVEKFLCSYAHCHKAFGYQIKILQVLKIDVDLDASVRRIQVLFVRLNYSVMLSLKNLDESFGMEK